MEHLKVDKHLHQCTSTSPTSTLTLGVHLGKHRSRQRKRTETVLGELLEALKDSSQTLIICL